MKCPKCGNENENGSKFCTTCGERIEEVREDITGVDTGISIDNKPVVIKTDANAESDGKATASLVLGICGFVIFCLSFPLSLIGLILGLVSKERSGKRTAAIIINAIVLGLSVLVSIYAFTTGFIEGFTEEFNKEYYGDKNYNFSNKNKTTPKSNTSEKGIKAGQSFEFDDLEITISSDYSFVTVNNQFSDYNGKDVVKIPISVKNLSSESNHLNMFYYNVFGSEGSELRSLSAYFDESIDYAGDLQPDASYTKYIYALYDGDGKYVIEFDNYKEKKSVQLDIKK